MTDGQTDRRTDRIAVPISRVGILTRDGNFRGNPVKMSPGNSGLVLGLTKSSTITTQIGIKNVLKCRRSGRCPDSRRQSLRYSPPLDRLKTNIIKSQECQLSQSGRAMLLVVKNFGKSLKSFKIIRNYTDEYGMCKFLLVIH